ncbi:MAG: fluoride efflux transporter CrcB [Phycisphaerales bacterium]
MLTWLCIFFGAGLGGVLRFALAGAAQRFAGPAPVLDGSAVAFPVGTLAVNVSGCLAIGVLAASSASWLEREEFRLGLIVGVLGGYTTFSAFALESLRLAETGQWGKAALYVVLSNALSLAACGAGMAITRWLTR